MNIGLVVEGPDDVATYPVIIKRIRPDVERVFPRDCQGRRNLRSKFTGFVKEFAARRDQQIGLVLVIQDSDCHASGPIEHQLRQRLEQAHLVLSFPVRFYATKCELETWLLADEDAINRVAQWRGKTQTVAPVNISLENHRDADTTLSRLLWGVGLSADPRVYAEIAQEIDLDCLRRRCPYFREFCARVRGT